MVLYYVMMTSVYIFTFIFGAIIGSFLNVVICRTHTGMKITGYSMCFSCNRRLRWYELIPIFSFMIQNARCRECKSKISWQYPIVEIITAVLFVAVVYKILPNIYLIQYIDLVNILFLWIISSLFIIISVYDIRHKIIPDIFSYSLAVFALVLFIFKTGFSNIFQVTYLWDLLAGPILATPFALLWFVSGGRWMGLGDAKLVLGIGWLLGLYGGISAIILAFWIGAVIALLLVFTKGRKYTMKTEIPFAPFLILATFLVFFFNLDLLSITFGF